VKTMKLSAILSGLFLFGTSIPVVAAPQTFNTALPVAEGEFIFRQQFFNKKANNDPGLTNRDVNVLGSVSVLGYGIINDLSIFGVVPLLDKTLNVTPLGGVRTKRTTSGFGDARLFARYTVFKQNAPGRTFRIAPFAGIKMPTGKSRVSDALGTLPAAWYRIMGSFWWCGGNLADTGL